MVVGILCSITRFIISSSTYDKIAGLLRAQRDQKKISASKSSSVSSSSKRLSPGCLSPQSSTASSKHFVAAEISSVVSSRALPFLKSALALSGPHSFRSLKIRSACSRSSLMILVLLGRMSRIVALTMLYHIHLGG